MHAQGRRKAVDDDVDLDDEEYFDDAQASPYSACMVQLTFAVELTPHETTFPLELDPHERVNSCRALESLHFFNRLGE